MTTFSIGMTMNATDLQRMCQILILCMVLTVPALAQDAPQEKPVEWADKTYGSILSVDGQPIPHAKVTLRLHKIHEYPTGRWDETVATRVAETDEHGRYELQTAELPKLVHRPFDIMLHVAANGYSDGKWWIWYPPGGTRRADQSHLADIKLLPGRLVVGRCIDPDGNPVVGAVVKTTSEYWQMRRDTSVGWDPVITDESGRFYLGVPVDREHAIESWICHPDWAPKHLAIPKDKEQILKIEMKPGGTLRGYVQKLSGEPAVGVVVAASSLFDGDLKALTFPVNLATKTDEQGRYEFPPLDGEYRVHLAYAARSQQRLEPEFSVSDQEPPLVIPQLVSIENGKDQILDFVEPPTVTVQGSIHWPDDQPAPGVEVRTFYMPDNFGTGIDLVKTFTDEAGHYSVELPKGLPVLGIMVSGANHSNGKWHYAHPSEHVAAARKSTQFINLDNVDEDRSDIDWVLKETYE